MDQDETPLGGVAERLETLDGQPDHVRSSYQPDAAGGFVLRPDVRTAIEAASADRDTKTAALVAAVADRDRILRVVCVQAELQDALTAVGVQARLRKGATKLLQDTWPFELVPPADGGRVPKVVVAGGSSVLAAVTAWAATPEAEAWLQRPQPGANSGPGPGPAWAAIESALRH